MSVTIKRPRLVLTGPKAKYISLNVGEPSDVNVIIRDEVLDNWDNIKKLVIGKKHYTQGTDPETGELSADRAFDRWEITDYITKDDLNEEKAEKLEDMEYQAQLDAMTRKLMKTPVLEGKDEALALAV